MTNVDGVPYRQFYSMSVNVFAKGVFLFELFKRMLHRHLLSRPNKCET